ncbi:cation diffusion facilitator family transporter [Trichocoleus desertorum AS-A10]|uniref:cation diffusion facilitator family transporter n=1 Tax=Trichocoleus desertorum TaxID=1481672 RepID=UPI0032971468
MSEHTPHHRDRDHQQHQHHQHQGHHGHHHSHGHHHGLANYNRAFVIGLSLNLGFVLTEAVFGVLAHSVSLLADAGHNLSDVLGLALAWGASLLAQRKPSRRYTYGWRRSSVLAAFFNAIFLLVVTGGIAWEAIARLTRSAPLPEVAGSTMIGVAALGIVINAATAALFLVGRKHDLNIRAAFLHMVADAIVSLGVVLAGLAILLTQWFWLDPVFSLVVSAIIITSTWQLLKEAFSLSMDAVPTQINEQAVWTYLTEQVGVTQVHDLHIWGMSTTETALTAHLVMPQGHPGDAFLAQMAQELHDFFGIEHTTLQIEMGNSCQACALEPDHRV